MRAAICSFLLSISAFGLPLSGCLRSPPPPSGYEELKAIFQGLPEDYRALSEKSLEESVRKVEEGIWKAEALLREPLEGTVKADVEYMLAHLLQVSFNRAVQERKVSGIELSARALGLVRSASAGFPEGSARREDCLLLEGRLLLKRASFEPDAASRKGDLEAMRERYKRFLAARPGYPDRSSLHVNVADSYFQEGNYGAARSYLEGILGSDRKMPEAFYCEEKLFDALTGTGNLEAMERNVLSRLSEYPARLGEPAFPAQEKPLLEDWLDRGHYWLGHVLFAKGDVPGARSAFLRQIARVDAREAALASRGEKMGGVAKVFRDLRSRGMVRFIDEKIGKRPALDFDLGDSWCTRERITLAGARGKVVAALFRNPGDQRSATFVRELDRFVREEGKKGLEAVVLGFVLDEEGSEASVRAMKEEMEALGVRIPSGFDPNAGDPKIFRAMGANVGSPSFIAFDRGGRFAWLLLDPRPMDSALAKSVLSRLLVEPAGEN